MLELIGILILIFIIVVDPYANFKYVYYGAICTVIFILFKSNRASFAFISSIIVLLSLVIYFSSQSSFFQSWMTPLSTALMILAITVSVSPYLRKWADDQTGLIGFVLNLLLFIPCLLYDIGTYGLMEIQKTPRTIWKILAGLVLVSILYFQSSTLISYVLSLFRGNYIQKEVLRFGTAMDPVQHTLPAPSSPLPLTHFTVDFWLYQNEPRSGTAAHTILNYGNRPHIQVRQNQLLISNAGDPPLPVGPISLQKWVYIVLVYDRNTCNVFVDGQLMASLSLPATNLARTHSDIRIGDENVFGDGAICLLRASSSPMTRTQIQTEYLYGKSAVAVL